MQRRKFGGQLVVLSSSQGYRPIPLLAAYSATKVNLGGINLSYNN
jgi:short-subunit dehydrogenase